MKPRVQPKDKSTMRSKRSRMSRRQAEVTQPDFGNGSEEEESQQTQPFAATRRNGNEDV